MGCGSISHPWGQSEMGKTYYRHASEEEVFCGLSSSPPYSHRAFFLVLATPKILCKVQTFLETDSTHEGGCGKISLYIFFSVLYFVKMLFLVMSLNRSETETESKWLEAWRGFSTEVLIYAKSIRWRERLQRVTQVKVWRIKAYLVV